MTVSRLSRESTVLVIVDVQAKLLDVVRRGPVILENIVRLCHLAQQLDLPVIPTEQYPRMYGPIAPEIAALSSGGRTSARSSKRGGIADVAEENAHEAAGDTGASVPTVGPITKMEFDCCAVSEFNDRLVAEASRLAKPAHELGIILAGLETHICILQTCLSLLDAGYRVHVPQDAVDSRTEEDWHVGIEMMRKAGAVVSSTETAIFQLLGRAGTPEFKGMLKLVT